MTRLGEIERIADTAHLVVMGAFHTRSEDGLASDGTLVLFGPGEPGFWRHVTAEPEFTDGEEDPLDRWSLRIVGRIARDLGGEALFPFGDPVRPFVSWALRTGRAWVSPVGLLVHDTAGLMVSYRGAILFPGRLDLPPVGGLPCDTCPLRPCLTACPVGALVPSGYDLPSCHAYLDSDPGADCMSSGCAVRRACPVSRSYGRVAGQSAYHMRQFHR